MSDSHTHDISQETISLVVTSIQRGVADFYGPQCCQTLLTSHTGKAVITSDGFTILETLQPGHPVAKLISGAVRRCHSYTLDGCKVFLIYLGSFVRAVEAAISRGYFCHSGVNLGSDNKKIHRRGAIYAGRYVRTLVDEVLPMLQQKLMLHCEKLQNNLLLNKSLKEILECVCRTTLAPHFNPKVCQHFSQVLMKLLPDVDGRNSFFLYHHTLQMIAKEFHLLCIKVPQRPYSECITLHPLVIRREFALNCHTTTLSSTLRAVILRTCIDGSNNDFDVKETVQINKKAYLSNSLLHRRKLVESFVQRCTGNKINVLLCTKGVPNYTLDIFRNSEISVISHMLLEDVDLLEMMTKTVSLSSVHEEILETNVVSLASIQKISIGGHWYIQLKLPFSCNIKHIIVCAPTVGLCDQTAMMLQKAIQSLLMCFQTESQVNGKERSSFGEENKLIKKEKNDSFCSETSSEVCSEESVDLEEDQVTAVRQLTISEMVTGSSSDTGKTDSFNKLFVIEGGGSFEVLLSNLLLDYENKNPDDGVSVLCKILTETLMSVVNVLHTSTSVVALNKDKGVLGVRTVLEEKIATGELWGLDRRGVPCDLSKKGVFEPLLGKMHVLHCVLCLAEQLLKVDQIVSVKTIK